MYGVPANLDLSFLHGAQLTQLCIGQWQLQFHFHPTGEISVEAGWELFDAEGVNIDGSSAAPEGARCQLHRLIGQVVIGTEVSPPQSISLRFEQGEVLRIFDDNEQYESFTIHPGGVVV